MARQFIEVDEEPRLQADHHAVKTTPMSLFSRGAEYLTDRIRNTKLARILNQRGNALARSFEQFRTT